MVRLQIHIGAIQARVWLPQCLIPHLKHCSQAPLGGAKILNVKPKQPIRLPMSNLRILKVLEAWTEWDSPKSPLLLIQMETVTKVCEFGKIWKPALCLVVLLWHFWAQQDKTENSRGDREKKRDTCLSPALKTAMIREDAKTQMKINYDFHSAPMTAHYSTEQ